LSEDSDAEVSTTRVSGWVQTLTRYQEPTGFPMTWIKTVSADDDDRVRRAMEAQRALYPAEYAVPIHPTADGQASQIVASHSLIEVRLRGPVAARRQPNLRSRS